MNFIKKNGFLSTKRLIFFQPHIEKGDSFEPPLVLDQENKKRTTRLVVSREPARSRFSATS